MRLFVKPLGFKTLAGNFRIITYIFKYFHISTSEICLRNINFPLFLGDWRWMKFSKYVATLLRFRREIALLESKIKLQLFYLNFVLGQMRWSKQKFSRNCKMKVTRWGIQRQNNERALKIKICSSLAALVALPPARSTANAKTQQMQNAKWLTRS